MVKTLCYILGLSTLIFAVLYLDACHRLKASELTAQAIRSVWEADMGIAQKQISLRDSFLLTQDNERAKDSAQHALKQKSLTGQINSLKSKLREKPVPFVIQDTIIFLQDSLIADLTNERDSLKISFETSIDTLNATIDTQKGQIKLCDSLMKELRVPPEPSRLSFGATGGVTALVRDGQVLAGPGVSIGLQYSIPIKLNLRKLFRRKH